MHVLPFDIPGLSSLDPAILAAGLFAGFVVGLTGMGGGAITTPLLILVFRVPAVAAVGTDLVSSVVMKLVGGGVHARAGTVRWDLVRRLSIVSVPAAVLGVVTLRAVGDAAAEGLVQRAVGLALLAAATSMVLRSTRVRRWLGRTDPADAPVANPVPLLLVVGAVVGFMVGLTSVGSGSLMIAALAWLHPRLSTAQLVGTDLAQGFVLVSAAAVAHLGIGRVDLALAATLLAGAVPGVLAGARLSSRAPDKFVRPALVTVLTATGLRLL